MKWSWKLGEVAGIGIFIHWTFLILIVWIVVAHISEGKGTAAAAEGVALVLAVFGCIVAHELGHSLTARRFGIRTRDITLLPIGGVARLERMPEDPTQELLVALAGPAVNVVIAAALFGAVAFWIGLSVFYNLTMVGGSFLAKLMVINVFLVAFNLLPAFPMDGGRVLRALLAMRLDYVKATRIAASVGQGVAVLFGIAAPFVNWFLLLIAAFVFLGAQQESQMVQVSSLLRGVPVREAMIRRFRTLSQHDPLPWVVTELLAGDQQDFPVLEQDRIVGILAGKDVLAAIAQGGQDGRVADVMQRDCPVVEETDMLEPAFRRMRERACRALPVVRDGQLIGMVTLENVSQWMMLQSALRRGRAAATVPNAFRGR